ncbi:MAG: hypothetical protein R2828_02960 [Saprospiraceae bacterium]
MYGKKELIISMLGLLYGLAIHCTHDQLTPSPQDEYTIKLRWVEAYEGEEIGQVMVGLQWSFSFLGASLPEVTWTKAVRFLDDRHFVLNMQELGFQEEALEAWRVIIERLKNSEEYQQKEAIDMARFLVLSLHSSWHYYTLTAAPKTLADYLATKDTLALKTFPVRVSSIAKTERMIRFQIANAIEQTFFIAAETEDITAPSYPVDHYEILDIMPSGQLRFLLYDAQGQLMPAAPIATTLAGKPSKCIWCHETNVQPLFQPTPDVPGFLKSEDFQLLVDSTNRALAAYRALLPTIIDFSDKRAHTQSELLYISFMEPSLQRIANEWEMEIESVKTIFQNLPTHKYAEFPFLGELYYRHWVDSLAPYRSERVPGSVREENEWEPNYFD